jgi:Ribosomal protein HS6-type (S12/L30/L7a)
MFSLEELKNGRKVVGTRRLLKALAAGEVAVVYLASDADLFIIRKIRAAANEAGARIVEADSMKVLGAACGIEVGTASCGASEINPSPHYVHTPSKRVAEVV